MGKKSGHRNTINWISAIATFRTWQFHPASYYRNKGKIIFQKPGGITGIPTLKCWPLGRKKTEFIKRLRNEFRSGGFGVLLNVISTAKGKFWLKSDFTGLLLVPARLTGLRHEQEAKKWLFCIVVSDAFIQIHFFFAPFLKTLQ